MFGNKKRRVVNLGTQSNDEGPMDEKNIAECVERVTKIARGEMDGFFVVIQKTKVDKDTIKAEGASKVTNANNQFMLDTMFETFGWDVERITKYLMFRTLSDD